MQDYQKEFLDLAIARSVLRFGRFELKSGRISPYFFNAGGFDSGLALATLGRCYARAIAAAGLDYDVLFGPAYKGIPLVAATAVGLATELGEDRPYCFNRKEAKDHGEGGQLVGAGLQGRVLVIDDVITAGTAIGESAAIIEAAGASLAGVVIALDRQERGQGSLSAVQEVEQRWRIPVLSIVTLGDVVAYLEGERRSAEMDSILAYRKEYGVASIG